MKVYIMRGLPGSGKTSYVNEVIRKIDPDNTRVCSADDHHMIDGEYRFDPKRAGDAHDCCLRKFLSCLEGGYHAVVDNTNTTAWEISPYYRLAEIHGFDVKILWMTTPLELCLHRQTHAVPHNTMARMFHNLIEPLPAHWNVEMISHVWRMMSTAEKISKEVPPPVVIMTNTLYLPESQIEKWGESSEQEKK